MGTHSAEDYVRAIHYLQNRDGSAHSSKLAEYLGISRAGVSLMLSSLGMKGLLRARKYSPVQLTPRGLALARKMTFKHRVLECFLSGVLKLRGGRVHREACGLEHAMSDLAARRLYAHLGRPKQDPHNQPIEAI